MSELFEQLPEVGDPEKPRLVFFFDEAHLLFRDAPKPLLEKVEQVVRLIRSKGVGVYFVTQNPADVPDEVLGQLGARVQHALRAYTPADQRGLKAAAASFRVNPAFDTAQTIQALGVGEALVSVLDEKGAPTVVQKTTVRPPDSRIGPLSPDERRQLAAQSPVRGLYDQTRDRESAFETLQARARARTAEPAPAPAGPSARRGGPGVGSEMGDMAGAFARSMLRSIGTQVGREIIRGVLGGLAGGSRRRR